MKIFVPDASVILKWVLREEEDHDYAFALLKGWINQEHEFILPSLWLYIINLRYHKFKKEVIGHY